MWETIGPNQAFAFLLLMCRLGSFIMVLPGIGEAYVYPRIRLIFALGLSAMLYPLLSPLLPAAPTSVPALFALITAEIITGIFMGFLVRILLSAMHTAGTIIATQSTLASAMMMDVTQTSQTTVITNLLSILAVTIMFTANLDHVLYMGLKNSYVAFPPGEFLPAGDMAQVVMRTVTNIFAVAMQLSAPHIVMGLIGYLAAGLLARLMPSMQVFFVLMAPQIWFSFFILMVVLNGMMLWYLNYLEDRFLHLVTP